jgi:hypothetical protein
MQARIGGYHAGEGRGRYIGVESKARESVPRQPSLDLPKRTSFPRTPVWDQCAGLLVLWAVVASYRVDHMSGRSTALNAGKGG